MPKAIDFTGKRIGILTALHPTTERKYGRVIWECKCECGKVIQATVPQLRDEQVKSCGCVPRRQKVTPESDIIGQRFGMLIVRKISGSSSSKHRLWECVCDCGGIKYATSGHLRQKKVRSCGCLRKSILEKARLAR